VKGLARTEKAATRLLALLAGGAAIVEPAARSGLLLVKNDKGAVSIEATLLAGLASEGSIAKRGDCISVTEAGLKAAKRNDGSPDSFQRQHREVDTIMIDNGASTSVAEINLSESPLALLMRLKSKDGRPFLSRAEFDAGERLRSDYTRGSIMPRLGANWEAKVASGRRGGSGGMAELTDAALAARQRVDGALRAVGPELSGLLVDVCCFLKGLETVERERAWPVRSAKLVLKTALGILARHYHPPRDAGARTPVLHWGAEDYRPDLG
jgi:hypothetical protein